MTGRNQPQKELRVANSSRALGAFMLFFLSTAYLLCGGFLGCVSSSQSTVRMRAYIQNNNQGWKTVQRKVGGILEIDGLKSDRVTIWLDLFRGRDGQLFQIMCEFKDFRGNAAFDPSRVMVRLGNGIVLRAKGLACSDVSMKDDVASLRSRSPISEPVFLKENDCYDLFFDHPGSSLSEEIVLDMNDSFALQGNPVDVPPVVFRKTTEPKRRWGFFQ